MLSVRECSRCTDQRKKKSQTVGNAEMSITKCIKNYTNTTVISTKVLFS